MALKAYKVLLVMSVQLRFRYSKLLKLAERKYLMSMGSSIFMHSSSFNEANPVRYFDSARAVKVPD